MVIYLLEGRASCSKLLPKQSRGDWGVMKHFFYIALQTEGQCKLETFFCVTRQPTGLSLKAIC